MGSEHGGGSRRNRWQPDCIGPFSKARFDSQSVQSLSHVQLFATPRTALQQASLSITTSGVSFPLEGLSFLLRYS